MSIRADDFVTSERERKYPWRLSEGANAEDSPPLLDFFRLLINYEAEMLKLLSLLSAQRKVLCFFFQHGSFRQKLLSSNIRSFHHKIS